MGLARPSRPAWKAAEARGPAAATPGCFFIICCKSQKPIGFATGCRSLQMSGGLREGSFCPHLCTCLPGVAVGVRRNDPPGLQGRGGVLGHRGGGIEAGQTPEPRDPGRKLEPVLQPRVRSPKSTPSPPHQPGCSALASTAWVQSSCLGTG